MEKMMDDKISDLAVKIESVDQRTKSNTHAIADVKTEIKDLREKQESIYELTNSVSLIAQSMTNIEEKVDDVKTGQKELESKFDNLNEKVEAVDAKTKIDFASAIKNNFWKIIFSIVGLIGVVKIVMDMIN